MQRKDKKGFSALQSHFLAFHVFHNHIVDLSEACAVFQNLPRLVGMIMDFDQLIIADRQKTVTFEIVGEVIVDFILIQSGGR